MESCKEDLKHARDHLRKAAVAAEDRILGREVAGHLRQAARHFLKAGISAIDQAEADSAGKPSDT